MARAFLLCSGLAKLLIAEVYQHSFCLVLSCLQMCRVLFDAIERSMAGSSSTNMINKLFTVGAGVVWG